MKRLTPKLLVCDDQNRYEITHEEMLLIWAQQSTIDTYKRKKKELESAGLKLGEVLFSVDGITLTCDGYEGPYITLTVRGEGKKLLQKAHCRLLLHALMDAIKWCEAGDAPGAC